VILKENKLLFRNVENISDCNNFFQFLPIDNAEVIANHLFFWEIRRR
jgi:hypothetical protein